VLGCASRIWRPSLLSAVLLIAANSAAQEVTEIPFVNAPAGTAALGGGLRSGQSPYFASDNEDERQLDLIPLYLYEGKYLFARGTAGGVHVIRNDAFEVNLYTRYRFQKLDPDSNEFYAGLEERKQSLDAGVELGLKQNWGELKLDWVADTLSRHNGQEVRFAYRYRFELGPWSISPFISRGNAGTARVSARRIAVGRVRIKYLLADDRSHCLVR
jgi:outer membrane protein